MSEETQKKAKNAVKFFEISTDDRERIESFYGNIFGWTFHHMPQHNYSIINIPGHGDFVGGVYDNKGKEDNWAVFCIEVDINEMEDISRQVVEAGGTITYPVTAEGDADGTTTGAQFLDPSGNRFSIFSFKPAENPAGEFADLLASKPAES